MRALVLSGGGSKGAWGAAAAAAIWRAYADTEEPVRHVAGTSVGALNAAKLVQDGPEALVSLWRRILEGDVFERPLGAITAGIRLAKGEGLFDSKPLWRLIQRELDPEKIRASGTGLTVHATCLRPRRVVRWNERSTDLLSGVYASAAIPIVFRDVLLRGRRYVDGGVLANTPLQSAIDAGATRITVVHLSPLRRAEHALYDVLPDATLIPEVSPLEALAEILDAMIDTQFDREMAALEARDNARAAMLDPLDQVPKIEIEVIAPERELGGALDFDRAHLDMLLEQGARAAASWLQE